MINLLNKTDEFIQMISLFSKTHECIKNDTGRAKVIWPDRLVLDPDRQIVPDLKMRSGI